MKKSYSPIIGALFLATSLLCTPFAMATEGKVAEPETKAHKKELAKVTVTHALVILPLGQSRDTQLFFTLRNNTSKQLVLTSIKATMVENIRWVPAQSQTPAWAIAAGEQLKVDGKKHYVHLQGLKQPVSNGDELLFELGFSDGSSLLLVAKARSAYDQIHGH